MNSIVAQLPKLPSALPSIVFEIPREFINTRTTCKFFSQITSSLEMNSKISYSRWKFIGRFIIIHSSAEQIYYAKRLDLPHYQISAQEISTFIAAIESFKRSTGRLHTLEVIIIETKTNHSSSDVNVFNTFSSHITEAITGVPTLQLAETVLKCNKQDTNRKNMFIDVGFASDRNSARNPQQGGVSMPRQLARTSESLFTMAFLGVSKLIDHVCHSEMVGAAFRDIDRQKLFAGSIAVGNLVEALRVSLTNENHLVNCHLDSKNDTITNFQGVVNYSKWLYLSDGQWWRLSLIGYSRKSISGFLRRKQLYMPLVEKIVQYMEEMPPNRVHVTSELLKFSGLPQSETAHRLKPHLNKTVFYSVYVYCLSQLQTKLDLSKNHLIALLYNVICSESPEYFWLVSKLFLEQSGKKLVRLCQLSPIKLSLLFYNHVWKKKKGVRDSSSSKVPGQRHQPHYNEQQPDSTVVSSIGNLYSLYLAFHHLDSKLAQDCHYFNRAVAYLEDSYQTTGVFGAGPLTSQHLIHVGVLVGLFPVELMMHADIGESTNSYKYLRRCEGLNDHKEDTRQLLSCLSNTTGLSFFILENLVCKYGQFKTKREVYVDSIYRGQFLYYFKNTTELVEVNEFDSRLIPTLATRCVKSTIPTTPPFNNVSVTQEYWMRKVKSKRVTSMKASTRHHLKRKLAQEVEAKTFCGNEKLNPTTCQKRVEPSLKRSEPLVTPTLPPLLEANKNLWMALHLPKLAMLALGFPPLDYKNLKLERGHFGTSVSKSKSISKVSARISVESSGLPNHVWNPPKPRNSGLLPSYYHESCELRDQKVWFDKRQKAIEYCFISAVFHGKEHDMISEYLVKPRMKVGDHTVYFDSMKVSPLEKRSPYAVVHKQTESLASFYFLDELGIALSTGLSINLK